MNSLKVFVLVFSFVLLAPLPPSQAAAPLRYHTFMAAVIEARVAGMRLADITPLVTGFPPGRGVPLQVQKISLKILKVEKMELNRTGSPLQPGETIEVINQYLDEKAPFAPGETIRGRVRLVLPEERYNAQDPRKQWWFFPPGEPEGFHPRHPFSGIQVVH